MASNLVTSIEDELSQQELILQVINKHFVSISDDDKSKYWKHLDTVLTVLIKHMKEADGLFTCLYQKFTYTGSYPDRLKVGKPEEFDMNLVMKLKCTAKQSDIGDNLEATDEPAFVKVNMKKVLIKMKESKHWTDCKYCCKVETWIDEEGYLLQTKVRYWMKSVLGRTFSKFPVSKQNPEMKELTITRDEIYKVKVNEHGPALTVTVLPPDGLKFEVDLVLAFGLEYPAWPPARRGQPNQIRKLPKGAEKKTWYIIPKPRGSNEGPESVKWRTSFQEQEGELLNGKRTVKPIIRLLKKMRTSANISTKDLSSYAIKTVVLWEMEELEKKKISEDFLKKPQGYLFVHMLACLIKCIEDRKIPYYWDKGGNLLDETRKSQKPMLGNLQRICKDIVNKIKEDKYIIAKKLLTVDELPIFQGLFEKLHGESVANDQPKSTSTNINKLLVQIPVTSLPKTSTTNTSSLENEVKRLKDLIVDLDMKHNIEMQAMKEELLENRATIKWLGESVNLLLTQCNISQHQREASRV